MLNGWQAAFKPLDHRGKDKQEASLRGSSRWQISIANSFFEDFQQPNPFCCNRSTTNLFMISFLSRTLDFFSFFLSKWIYVAGRDQSAADQPNNLAEGHPSL